MKNKIQIEMFWNDDAPSQEIEFEQIIVGKLPKKISNYYKPGDLWTEVECYTDPAEYEKDSLYGGLIAFKPIEQKVFWRFLKKGSNWYFGGEFSEKAEVIKGDKIPIWASNVGVNRLLKFPSENKVSFFGSKSFYELINGDGDEEFLDQLGECQWWFNEGGDKFTLTDTELVTESQYDDYIQWKKAQFDMEYVEPDEDDENAPNFCKEEEITKRELAEEHWDNRNDPYWRNG